MYKSIDQEFKSKLKKDLRELRFWTAVLVVLLITFFWLGYYSCVWGMF